MRPPKQEWTSSPCPPDSCPPRPAAGATRWSLSWRKPLCPANTEPAGRGGGGGASRPPGLPPPPRPWVKSCAQEGAGSGLESLVLGTPLLGLRSGVEPRGPPPTCPTLQPFVVWGVSHLHVEGRPRGHP